METRWKVFETRVTLQDSEALSDATHIQRRDEIPLTWAVPLGGREQAGRFWAFFPTDTPNLTSGILNAPWKLNSDRTNLIRGPWNESIMEEAAELIANSLPALATKEDQGASVSAFPRQPDRLDDIAVPLVRSLWDRILGSPVLPTADGNIRTAVDVKRHFVENTEECARWSELASPRARAEFLHPDCYRFQIRISRIRALQDEAKRRGMAVLPKVSVEDWLEPIAATNVDHAKRVLMLVGQLLEDRFKYKLFSVPDVPLIPTVSGDLAVPSEAIIAHGAKVPPGYVAVSDKISSDKTCKRILVDRFKLRVFSEASWKEHIDTSLRAASRSSDPQGWDNFWRGLAAAPKRIVESFIASIGDDPGRLKFRTPTGSWAKRDVLVVGRNTPVPDEFVLDTDYIRELCLDLPAQWLSKLPVGTEIMPKLPTELDVYSNWVADPFKGACWKKVRSRPHYGPVIKSFNDLQFPAGWRLLPHLPRGWAANLTRELIDRACVEEPSARPVTLVHPTRATPIPK